MKTLRALTLLASIATAACGVSGVAPRVVSLRPGVVVEGNAAEIDIVTEGFELMPTFDLDRGQGGDDVATVVLDEGRHVCPARRGAPGHIIASLSGEVPAGLYDVRVQTSAGRSARLADALRVTSASLAIERAWSDVQRVSPGARGVPLNVRVFNRGRCDLRGMTVVPRFVRDGVDRAGSEFIAREQGAPSSALAAGDSAIVRFSVEVLAGAVPAEVSLDAYAVGERHGDGACTGSANAPFADEIGRWIVTGPSAVELDIVSLIATPQVVSRADQEVQLTAHVLNRSASAITLESGTVDSLPAGAVLVESNHFEAIEIAPGSQEEVRFDLVFRAPPATRTEFALSVHFIGRDASGTARVPTQSASQATVTYYPR